jgi:hypothetical protein
MVHMSVGGQPVDFMVDTGAEHSMVTQWVAPISKRYQTIVEATGILACCPFLQPQKHILEGHLVTHESLYI